MKTKIITRGLVASVAALFAILLTAVDGNAQGRYVGQYSKAQVDQIIRRLEDSGDTFRNDFRREVDRSNLSSTQKRTYRSQVDRFENATDRLRSHFNSQNNWWNSRSQVQSLLNEAHPLNNTMNSIGFRRNIERQWTSLRNDVNTLADTFDLPGLEGGGWWGGGGGGWNPGVGRPITPPSWAQGTFYGRAPNGTQITLTINNNGYVSAMSGGSVNHGTFVSGNRLYINGNTSRVTRQGNGIRTTSTSDRQVINYSRSGWGGGGPGGPGATVPPSWAQGTFFGRGPRGESITLTIDRNGSVTSNVNGSMNYGRYNNGIITINESSSRVTQVSRGIRTTSMSDGAVINYRKN